MLKSAKAIKGPGAGGNSGQWVQTQSATLDASSNLPVLDPNDINIVLVGETGVGKSTFINAFVNYLKFSSLEEATASPTIHCLIASKFTIADENFEERVVSFGKDENESHAIGASSTQSTRSYRFLMDNRHVRLIDTPGIGDTRGILRDEENFDRVLEALAELKSVHAFCILLKPNNARLTVLFKYCIKQLLTRLDKTASRNIVFVFTNSRNTFYRPGDTLSPLKVILKSIKDTSNVDIPFGKKNVFCMDNEAFRFLLADKAGIQFSEDEKDDFTASWKKSVEVSFRMLSYIVDLAPHKIQDTISINEARRLIINLSKPLALVAKIIDDNLRNIDRRQEEISDTNKSITELKQLLHFDMIRIKVIDIDHPKTVCTHTDCTDVYMVEGSKNIDYKQVCHRRCYLKNVPKQVIGSPELRECAAMNDDPENPHCIRCKHSFALHMHVYFETEPYTTREIDKSIDANIKKKEMIKSRIADVIAYVKQQSDMLRNEQSTIQKSVSKFAHFLTHNAITPYNDTYREYIEYLIKTEENSPSKKDNLIKSYYDLIKVHKEKVALLDKELKEAKKRDSEANVITSEDIMNLVQELYRLEYSGKVIRDFYDKQQRTRQAENLLHHEKKVDTGYWYDPIKKAFNRVPRAHPIGCSSGRRD